MANLLQRMTGSLVQVKPHTGLNITLICWNASQEAYFRQNQYVIRLLEELIDWGKKLPGGNAEMVKLLRLCVDHGEEKILAVKHSLPSGIIPTVDIIRTHLHKPAENQSTLHMSNEQLK